MPIPAGLVERSVDPITHRIDARWTMAYAAGLGLADDCYLDTTRPDGIVAHPLFAVCPEWAVIVAARVDSERAGLTAAEVATGVHANHDLTIHRLIRPGDVLTTTLSTVAVEAKRPGARVRSVLHTVDADGRPVATTRQDAIYLGVGVDGADRPDPDPPAPPPEPSRHGAPVETVLDLPAGAAHVYTECARIWNPIHTDLAVAASVGLPGLILHGTANLAHGVSAVIDASRNGGFSTEPERVRRIVGRFSAMVPLPSRLTLAVWPGSVDAAGTRSVAFEVRNEAGRAAVADGVVVLG